ncbi:MAG: hypothetical protein RI885_2571 [Actinomycetota bacterium]|jgi:uridine kinase
MTDPLDLITALLPTDRPAIVAIDGRSGSGKTTVAESLVGRWEGSVLLRLDDVYPGWDGLRRGSDLVRRNALEPLKAGRGGVWTQWDWAADVAGPEHPIPAASWLIVEGCGVLSRRARPLLDLAVWIELDAQTREARALARDGDLYAPHWDRWAAQEEAFIAEEGPVGLADLVIDGHAIGG